MNKIVFDKDTLKVKSIYGIQHSKNPTNYKYFVEGRAVTENEYYSYRHDNVRHERMEFSQFEMSCSYPINAEQAWNLANAYWDNQDGATDCGAGTTWTARIELIDTPNSETDYYRFAFLVEWHSNGGGEGDECMPPYSIETKDQILVNAFTGEVVASTYNSNGNVISVDEAIEIAKDYRTQTNGDACNEENGYRVDHVTDMPAPDHFYVIVIQKHDTIRSRIWIDKYTGKIVNSYYLWGK